MKIFIPVILIILLSSCTNFLFAPIKQYPIKPEDVKIPYRDIYIQSSEGDKLHGWELLTRQKKKGTILFFHGNGDNVSTQMPSTFWLPEKGYDVYIFDYSGYGKSEGFTNLHSTIKDLELMIQYVVTDLADDQKLIIMGHSLGASMAIYAVAHSAHRDKIKALVSIAAFSDYHKITQEFLARYWLSWLFQWPLSLTVNNTYKPVDSIGLISPIPILIMHSKSDQIININHSKILFNAANEPKSYSLIEGNHNNVFTHAENRKLLLDYLNNLK